MPASASSLRGSRPALSTPTISERIRSSGSLSTEGLSSQGRGRSSWNARGLYTGAERIGLAKDDPYGPLERPHLGLSSGPAPKGPPKAVVKREEGRLGTRGGYELLVEERHELFPHPLVPDEPLTNLPPVEPMEQVEPAGDKARDVPQNGRGEQEDGLRRARGRCAPVVGVKQHQRRGPLWMPQGPVDRRRSRGVVGHQHDILKPQRPDDGVEVPGLIVGGIGVALWLVRASPTEEVEDYDAPPRQVRHQPVVEVQIIREAVHQHESGSLSGVLPHVYAVCASQHPVFVVLHLFTFFPHTV